MSVQVGIAVIPICHLGKERPTKFMWHAMLKEHSEGNTASKTQMGVVQLTAGSSPMGMWTAVGGCHLPDFTARERNQLLRKASTSLLQWFIKCHLLCRGCKQGPKSLKKICVQMRNCEQHLS